jgi:replication initiation protein RepC
MTMESALEAPGRGFAGSPTGFRRLTPGLLKADRTAESFAGLPDGVTMHGQLLAAFKAAAPRLGLSPRLVHAIDWLFRFTMAQDWGRGGRPIVWPSASVQQEALGLSPTQAKAINRAMIEAPTGNATESATSGATLSKPMASTDRRSPRATPSSCGWRQRPGRSG